jgi:hypothetical protein
MNDKKLKQLFEAARKETAPVPPEDFAADVLRVVRSAPPAAAPQTPSLFDQLNALFPRVALAAATLVVVCVAADFTLTAAGVPELGDGAAQVSSQFFLDTEGL